VAVNVDFDLAFTSARPRPMGRCGACDVGARATFRGYGASPSPEKNA
jgi:hypothetical protein